MTGKKVWAVAEGVANPFDPTRITPALRRQWQTFPEKVQNTWAFDIPPDEPALRPRRACLKCGETFQPTVKRTRLCEGCYREASKA